MASLLIGYRDDPHLLSVSSAAERLGVKCVIFDPHSVADRIVFDLGTAGKPRLTFVFDQDDSDVEFRSVWFRFKPIVELPHWGPMQTSAAQFAQGEWRTTLRALERFLPDALWINQPHAQLAANSKIVQLINAKECGFRVPETVITNDPQEVIDFIHAHGRVVYKTLEFAGFPDQTGVYTTEIDENLIRENARSIKRAPGIFQKFIEKAFELRVTVIGDKMFTARINTPTEGKGTVDWRYNIFDSMYEPWDLDAATKKSITAFQEIFGLTYGAYDLVRTPSGETFFLECNPAGQYLWLEQEASLPISEAIASVLWTAEQNGNVIRKG